ncbi:zinc finger HIT domain-containing protein 3 [Haemaphysalis longicornis]
MAVELCGVCGSAESRYRCPRCRTVRYCSCDCYRRHRQAEGDGCCREPAPAPAPLEEPEPGYRYPTPDTVPREKLLRLRDSEAVRACLRNRHLRALLRELDASRDPERLLEALMQEPIFVEFANACLDVVVDGDDG